MVSYTKPDDSGIAKSNMSSISRILRKSFDNTEEVISVYLTAFVITCMVAAVVIELLARVFLSESIMGLPEAIELAVEAITFTGMAVVQREQAHIRMDMIINLLMKRRIGVILNSISHLLVLLLIAFFCYALAWNTLKSYQWGHSTGTIYLKIWPVHLLVTIASVILWIRLAIQMKDNLLPQLSQKFR
jgi:TRAP-type C4-dicarboxylate transport system permease small subunit